MPQSTKKGGAFDVTTEYSQKNANPPHRILKGIRYTSELRRRMPLAGWPYQIRRSPRASSWAIVLRASVNITIPRANQGVKKPRVILSVAYDSRKPHVSHRYVVAT